MPDLLGKERVDIYAKKDNIDVYCECKKLMRKEIYTDLAIKVMSRLHQKKLNLVMDLELLKKPKSIENLITLVEKAAEEGKSMRTEDVIIQVQLLPELIEGVFEIRLPQPETVEYVVSAAYMDIFDNMLKVKEPKVLVIRSPNKSRDLKERLKGRLREAYDQLKTVKGCRKVIYVDISEVAGKIVLQLPELIRFTPEPEIVASQLEEESRNWLVAHSEIDAIALTKRKLYIDELGNPSAITLESQIATAYTAPGWTIMVRVVPMPRDATPDRIKPELERSI